VQRHLDDPDGEGIWANRPGWGSAYRTRSEAT